MMSIATAQAWWAWLYNPLDPTLAHIFQVLKEGPYQGRQFVLDERWETAQHVYQVVGIGLDLPLDLLDTVSERGEPLLFPSVQRPWELALFDWGGDRSNWVPLRCVQCVTQEELIRVAPQWVSTLQLETILKGELS